MARRGKNWDKRSKKIRDEEECAKCGEEYPPSELEAHHRTHFPGNLAVPDWALEPLCRTCHTEVHEKYTESPGSRSNKFEKAVSKASKKIDEVIED